MPNSTRSAAAEYLSGPRLPGAQRFDLDEVAELDAAKNPLSLTHMLPTAEKFSAACREPSILVIVVQSLTPCSEKLGISKDSHVVVYDSVGVFSSPRAVFTFKSEFQDDP